MFKVPEKYRLEVGPYASTKEFGNNGAFIIPIDFYKRLKVICICSDGAGWEHVSVSLLVNEKPIKQTPSWDHMCTVKEMFWDDEDTVIQYHPPKSTYVNQHEYCLHLWRKIDFNLPVPESILVGTNKKS
jgi:hypothetical protein